MAKELHADSLQSFEDLSTGFEANREKTEEKRDVQDKEGDAEHGLNVTEAYLF